MSLLDGTYMGGGLGGGEGVGWVVGKGRQPEVGYTFH